MDWLPLFPALAQEGRWVGGSRHQHISISLVMSVGKRKYVVLKLGAQIDDRYQLQHKLMRAPIRGLLNIIPA